MVALDSNMHYIVLSTVSSIFVCIYFAYCDLVVKVHIVFSDPCEILVCVNTTKMFMIVDASGFYLC